MSFRSSKMSYTNELNDVQQKWGFARCSKKIKLEDRTSDQNQSASKAVAVVAPVAEVAPIKMKLFGDCPCVHRTPEQKQLIHAQLKCLVEKLRKVKAAKAVAVAATVVETAPEQNPLIHAQLKCLVEKLRKVQAAKAVAVAATVVETAPEQNPLIASQHKCLVEAGKAEAVAAAVAKVAPPPIKKNEKKVRIQKRVRPLENRTGHDGRIQDHRTVHNGPPCVACGYRPTVHGDTV